MKYNTSLKTRFVFILSEYYQQLCFFNFMSVTNQAFLNFLKWIWKFKTIFTIKITDTHITVRILYTKKNNFIGESSWTPHFIKTLKFLEIKDLTYHLFWNFMPWFITLSFTKIRPIFLHFKPKMWIYILKNFSIQTCFLRPPK